MGVVFAPDVAGQAGQPIALAGGWWMLTGTLTFSGSYATGGDALDLTKYSPGGGTIRRVIPVGHIRGLTPEYDLTNKKLKIWNPGAAPAVAEHTAAAYDSDVTASAIPVLFFIRA